MRPMLYAHNAKKHLAAIQALNEGPAIGNYVAKLSEQLRYSPKAIWKSSDFHKGRDRIAWIRPKKRCKGC